MFTYLHRRQSEPLNNAGLNTPNLLKQKLACLETKESKDNSLSTTSKIYFLVNNHELLLGVTFENMPRVQLAKRIWGLIRIIGRFIIPFTLNRIILLSRHTRRKFEPGVYECLVIKKFISLQL